MKITAVIILYNCHNKTTLDNIRKIAMQVDKAILVDNSICFHQNFYSSIKNVIYIPQFKNIGIAAAQNVGIKKAFELQAEYVLLADPDSEVPDGAITKLLEKYRQLSDAGIIVGAIGSTAYDKKTGIPIPLHSDYIGENKELGVTEVTYVMNSISLIPKTMFKNVGLMDADLFIDGVDSEWCWRATSLTGARFFLHNDVIIEHQLGLGMRKILGKERSLATPPRLYYQYRNFLWLSKRKYIPKEWIRLNRKKYIAKALYYPFFVSPRLDYLKNIIQGLYAGIHNPRVDSKKPIRD